jgi:CubicO group peptidase (beta-lactamase class C family)
MSGTLREGSATEAGLSAKQLDVARDLAAQFVKDGILPALVVLVARHGVIALHEAFGVLGPEPDDPPLPRDAIFLLASLTKPVTATALMVLVEDGRVGLTRPVREYIPEFEGDGKDKVFVHHLLTHTSGIETITDIEELTAEFRRRLEQPPLDPTIHPTLDAMLQLAYERPLRKAPGEEMFYDSANYDLLGEIVRRASGRSLADFTRERIFEPLGMADSSVGLPPERRDRAVCAVAESPSAIAWSLPMADSANGSGSMYSTALDMATFGQAFLNGGGGANGRVLGPATVRETITNQIPGIPGVVFDEVHGEASWGYGWGIACHEKWAYFPTHPVGTFQHGGSTGVYLWCDPTNDLVGAFFGAAVKEIAPDELWWNVDLFVNASSAAIED